MKFDSWVEQTRTPNRRCKVCALATDVRAEVEKAYQAGYGSALIRKYLASLGHGGVTLSSLENHKRGGHA